MACAAEASTNPNKSKHYYPDYCFLLAVQNRPLMWSARSSLKIANLLPTMTTMAGDGDQQEPCAASGWNNHGLYQFWLNPQ